MRYFTLIKTSDRQAALEYASFQVSIRKVIVGDILYSEQDFISIKQAFNLPLRSQAIEYLLEKFNQDITKVKLSLVLYSKMAGYYVKNGKIKQKLKTRNISYFDFYQECISVVEQARDALTQKLLNL